LYFAWVRRNSNFIRTKNYILIKSYIINIKEFFLCGVRNRVIEHLGSWESTKERKSWSKC
jgi:hypothetical protein